MTIFIFIVPLTLFVLLCLWVWTLCHALRKEHDYLWIWLLVLAPPLGIPLYLLNFFVFGDRVGGLTAWKLKTGKRRRAEELQAMLQETDLPAIHEELADIHYELEQWDTCLRHLQKALDHDPESLRLQYLAAKALLASQRPEAALTHLRYIVKTDKRYDTWQAMLLLAQVLEYLGKKEEALERYRELAKQVTFPEALYHYARAYWDTPERDKARTVLERMVASYEADPGQHPKEDAMWVREAKKLLEKAEG